MKKILKHPEPPVTKLSFENTIHRIFTQKYDKLKFYPFMKRFYPWIELSSTEKIMDDLFILGCHLWIKSSNNVVEEFSLDYFQGLI